VIQLAQQAWVPVAVISGFVLLVAVIVIGSAWTSKKRREALEALADEMGFDFDKSGGTAEHWKSSGFKLFSRGSKRCRNAMTRRIEDVDVCVFRYSYTTGSGKNRSTTSQSVVALTTPGLDLPRFTCEPEHFFHAIGEMFGMQDIDIDHRPEFSKQRRLTGEDEAAVRELFDRDRVVEFCLANPKMTFEGQGNRLVAYERGRTQRIGDYRAFAENAMELVLVFS